MKRNYLIGVGILVVIIVAAFFMFGGNGANTDINSNGADDEGLWGNIQSDQGGESCDCGRSTVGCIPYPTSDQTLPRGGSYSKIISQGGDVYGNLSNFDGQSLILEVLDVEKVGEECDYNIKVQVDLEGNLLWIETGSRFSRTMGGHFQAWQYEGFNPKENDKVQLDVSLENTYMKVNLTLIRQNIVSRISSIN